MSYESKDMKMGWQAINGKQVPFVYPQYWSEEKQDWVITSEENRLPVDAQLTGSIEGLSTDDKPEVIEGYSYLEYDVEAQEMNVYKGISGEWRLM